MTGQSVTQTSFAGVMPPKRVRTKEESVDELLKRVLWVTITEPSEGAPTNIVYVKKLADELVKEGRPLLLSSELAEPALFDRLSTLNVGPETRLQYLVGAYRRSLEEGRKVEAVKDKGKLAVLQTALQVAKGLVVSYAGILTLHPEMFPQPPPVTLSPGSPLTELIIATFAPADATTIGTLSSPETSPLALPRGFLDQFVERFDGDGLSKLMAPVFSDLAKKVESMSLLGPFQGPLRAFGALVAYPPLARVCVGHMHWMPVGPQAHGRYIETFSLLGPFLRISCIPDRVVGNGIPSVRQQCFSKPSERRPADINSSFLALKAVQQQLQEGLLDIFRALLKLPDTREHVLQYLALAINSNASRSQMQMDPRRNACHGYFFNLSAVMLKLCAPFMDPLSPKNSRINPDYVLARQGGRLDFSQLTALYATSDEVASWVEQRNLARQESYRHAASQQQAEEVTRVHAAAGAAPAPSSASTPLSPSFPDVPASNSTAHQAGVAEPTRESTSAKADNFHFVSECFFMTARTLHLGLLKVVSESAKFGQRETQRAQSQLRSLEALRGDGQPHNLEHQIQQLKIFLDDYKEVRLCYEASLQDLGLMQQVVQFYRLMAVWLVRLIGGFKMPLPVPCPMEFASMPEHFVEDMLQALLRASQIPHGLEGIDLNEFVSFIVMFMGSPLHVKNPYLRATMVEVLQVWMPPYCPTPALKAEMAAMFEGHPLALQYLTPNLLRLYVDIEFTGSHNVFYEKFSIRLRIAELLEYLWGVPSHRTAWKKLAVEEERGFYIKFLSLLVNDSIYLLDDCLERIPRAGEEARLIADTSTWTQLPLEERRQREETLHHDEGIIRYQMQAANADVRMLQYSTEEVVRPFLQPELVERIAGMLNYFLLQLVGPKRRALKVNNPAKFEFEPRQLLSQIVDIYVHLAKEDNGGLFAEAISQDGRSYRQENFEEAALVLKQHELVHPEILLQFEALGKRVQVAAAAMMDIESQLGDIPEEFLDPIQCTLMRDPVILPSNVRMERGVILRHLLSDPKDPFNRAPCTVEMLIPDLELKARIDEFIASHSTTPPG